MTRESKGRGRRRKRRQSEGRRVRTNDRFVKSTSAFSQAEVIEEEQAGAG
jgi:hypothetical protein